MLDSRGTPASRIQAARAILDLASVERRAAKAEEWEQLDPRAAALERLTETELLVLGEVVLKKVSGMEPNRHEISVAKKYAAIEQEIRALKQRGLGVRPAA